jgi:hypothetical protein
MTPLLTIKTWKATYMIEIDWGRFWSFFVGFMFASLIHHMDWLH